MSIEHSPPVSAAPVANHGRGLLIAVLAVLVLLVVGLAGGFWFMFGHMEKAEDARLADENRRLARELEELKRGDPSQPAVSSPSQAPAKIGTLSLLQVLPEGISVEDRRLEWYEVGGDSFALSGIMYAPKPLVSTAHFKIAGKTGVEYVPAGGYLPLLNRVQVRSIGPKSVVVGLGSQELVLHWRAQESLYDLGDAVRVRPSADSKEASPDDPELPRDPRGADVEAMIRAIRERDAAEKAAAASAASAAPVEDDTLFEYVRDPNTWESFVREVRKNFTDDLRLATQFDDLTKQALGVSIKRFAAKPLVEKSKLGALPTELESYGMRIDDIIFAVNEAVVMNRAELLEALETQDFSRQVVVDFERGGVEYRLIVRKGD